MVHVANPGHLQDREAVGGQAGTPGMPSLPSPRDRGGALECDSGEAPAVDVAGDRGAPGALHREPSGGSTGVHDRVSEDLDRWHRYGGVTFAGVPVAQYWAEF